MEYNSHLWAGASKSALHFVDRIQSQVYRVKLIGDDRVASSITSLGHRTNVSCRVLFYNYYFGKCSPGLSELVPPPLVFMRNTRLAGRSHAYTVETMSHRTTHYRENCTARLWNNLPADIFPTSFNISLFKARINQHFLLSPPSI